LYNKFNLFYIYIHAHWNEIFTLYKILCMHILEFNYR
jgi:hypothetical protein